MIPTRILARDGLRTGIGAFNGTLFFSEDTGDDFNFWRNSEPLPFFGELWVRGIDADADGTLNHIVFKRQTNDGDTGIAVDGQGFAFAIDANNQLLRFEVNDGSSHAVTVDISDYFAELPWRWHKFSFTFIPGSQEVYFYADYILLTTDPLSIGGIVPDLPADIPTVFVINTEDGGAQVGVDELIIAEGVLTEIENRKRYMTTRPRRSNRLVKPNEIEQYHQPRVRVWGEATGEFEWHQFSIVGKKKIEPVEEETAIVFYHNDDFNTFELFMNNMIDDLSDDEIIADLNTDYSEGYFDFFTFGWQTQRNVAIDSHGRIYLAYRFVDENNDTYVWLKYSDDGGETWVAERVTDSDDFEEQPNIIVDSNDILHITWFNNGENAFKYRTRDRDGNYTSIQQFPDLSWPAGLCITIDSNDIVHYVSNSDHGADTVQLYYGTIENGTISTPEFIGIRAFPGYFSIAQKNGIPRVVAASMVDNKLYFLEKNGSSWTQEEIVGDPESENQFQIFTINNIDYIFGGDYNDGFADSTVRLFENNGGGWQETFSLVVPGASVHHSFAVTQNGNIYCSWLDWDNGRIRLLKRIDGVWSNVEEIGGNDTDFFYVWPTLWAI